jgi:AcrR family transcriptional regulator
LPYSSAQNPTKERILIDATVLFAIHGYAAVSVRDIAEKVGITPGALYNHFESKEMLWAAVINHAEMLYMFYFSKLNEELKKAASFREVVELFFIEPTEMKNMFTNYAFGLVQSEQFRDELASKVFANTFIGYGIDFIRRWFDICIESGNAKRFDTQTAAANIMHGVMTAINLAVQQSLKRSIPYDIPLMFTSLKMNILEQGSIE